MLNMFSRALNLPSVFHYDGNNEETGGGVLQSSASDGILLALLAARARAVKLLQGTHQIHKTSLLPQLVAYTSEEAHSCVQKAAQISIIRLRIIKTDEHGAMDVKELAETIERDVKVDQLIPVFVSATVGTTGTCAFDSIEDIGRFCTKYDTIWFHVDGAYGGSSFMLEEMDKFKRGIEYADSFGVNPNKFLLTSIDCSCLWVKRMAELKEAMAINPTYLERDRENGGDKDMGEDLRNYAVPLSRRFRSLKLWFVLRNYGIKQLKAFMRNHIALAKYLEKLIRADARFSIENDVHLGLVCFRLIDPNASEDIVNKMNMEFLQRMNKSGEIHMVPTTFHGRYIIRFCITKERATEKEIGESANTSQNFQQFCNFETLELNALGQKGNFVVLPRSFCSQHFARFGILFRFDRQFFRDAITSKNFSFSSKAFNYYMYQFSNLNNQMLFFIAFDRT